MKRKILIALGCLAFATAAIGAGVFTGYPIVGGLATCANFATNPTTGAVLTTCNGPAIPAGPTQMSGNELIPADTALTQGTNPATVRIPSVLVASGSLARSTPLTSYSVVIPNGASNYLITPAGTIAALTVTMPSAPYQEQTLSISSSQTIITLTLNGAAGQTISNAPTAITISTTGTYGYKFVYLGTVWYRLN
jgi:hypothetical protein